ncbi:AraC family transcriptional regulator [Paraburkholderia edwinii]|uniref:AraC family transcriptional regulator n=1 Tax=Paraburkholderia edwinii TaxID=2861782 RepID=A0ABX8UFB6_9BURK|nr:AraC family transcriptional regulator [Paraburkholderia edwinii]QYD67081.1 AraC family transcriptional regulator [Paraburkholderia edwinii]
MTPTIVEYPAHASPEQREKWKLELENLYGLTCPSDPEEHSAAWSKSWYAGQVGVLDSRVKDQTRVSLPPGKHPISEDSMFVVIIASGSVVISQHGEERTFTAGSVLTLDPAWSYGGRFVGSTRLVALRLPKLALKARGYIYGSRRIMVPEQSSSDVTLLREMLISIAESRELPSPQFREKLGEQMLDMTEALLQNTTGSAVSRRSDLILVRAKATIARHLGDSRLNLEQIAAELRISANYLARLFRMEGGTAMRYVLEKRLERAHSLLKQSGRHRMQIQEIAYLCGFESPSHFSRTFKQHFGVSPRDATALYATPSTQSLNSIT